MKNPLLASAILVFLISCTDNIVKKNTSTPSEIGAPENCVDPSFATHVEPTFNLRCSSCHSPESELPFNTEEQWIAHFGRECTDPSNPRCVAHRITIGFNQSNLAMPPTENLDIAEQQQILDWYNYQVCLLYTSPSPRDS